MAGEFWTTEEEEVLKRLIAKGVDMDSIHRVLKGRSKSAIVNKMDAMELRRRDFRTSAIDYKALELLDV
jgi:hypothetical protein